MRHWAEKRSQLIIDTKALGQAPAGSPCTSGWLDEWLGIGQNEGANLMKFSSYVFPNVYRAIPQIEVDLITLLFSDMRP